MARRGPISETNAQGRSVRDQRERRAEDEGIHLPSRAQQDERAERFGARRADAEARQKQRREPDETADCEPARCALPRRVAPEHAADQRRSELRDPGEGDQPDRGEPLPSPRGSRVKIAERKDADDREAAGEDDGTGKPHRRGARRIGKHRRDDVLRDHHREGQRRDDHHGRRRRQPADEGDEGERLGALGERHRQDEEVGLRSCRQEG